LRALSIFRVTGLLVIAFAAYLLVGALHEFGEAGAGETLEIAGPAAAILFAAICGWLYVRGSRAPVAASER
jgi:lipopolysaccharide export LptBFGC system permease protein LptF